MPRARGRRAAAGSSSRLARAARRTSTCAPHGGIPFPRAPAHARRHAPATAGGGLRVSVDTQFGGGMFRPPSQINVYTARRPHKRWTFWRILRWTLAVVLMSGVTVGGAVAYYVWNRLERITTTNDPNLKAADKQLAAVVDPATQPAVALVLGYDKRYGSGSARGHSDTLMLIRVDPKTKIALAALAAARPLRQRPGHRHAQDQRRLRLRRRAARDQDGEPGAGRQDQLLRAGQLPPLPQDGGHVPRRLHRRRPALLPRQQRLRATTPRSTCSPATRSSRASQALQYVRYRHLDSDFMRTARQQAFVREFKRRLDVWSAGTNLFGLLDSLPNDLKVRGSAKGQSVGPKTILRYIKLLAEIPRGNMVQVRLSGDTPTLIERRLRRDGSPRGDPRRPSTEFQNPNPAISQAVTSRFGGTRRGRREEAGEEEDQGPEADPAGQAARRHGQRLRRAGRRDGGQGRAPEGRLAAHERRRHLPQTEPLLDLRLLHEPRARTSRPRRCGARWAIRTPRCSCRPR